MARPLAAPPEVPPERLTALRTAFDATMKDPKYIEDAERIGLDVNPLGGEEIAAQIKAEVAKWTPVVKASGARPEQ